LSLITSCLRRNDRVYRLADAAPSSATSGQKKIRRYQANCASVARRKLTGTRLAKLCADADQLTMAVAAIHA
jgi:hypothetical protein